MYATTCHFLCHFSFLVAVQTHIFQKMDSGDEIFITQNTFRSEDYDTDTALYTEIDLMLKNGANEKNLDEDTYPHFSDISDSDAEHIAAPTTDDLVPYANMTTSDYAQKAQPEDTDGVDQCDKKASRFKEPTPDDVMEEMQKKQ